MKRSWLVFGLLAVTWCSSSSSSSEIPSRPDATAATGQTLETFAINEIFLGEAPLAGGAPSNTAWKEYGYDLDGLVTTKSSTDVCELHAGAPTANQADGTGGIDNGFGFTLLPIFEVAASLPTPSISTTQTIQSGAYTLQIQVDGLVPGSGPVTGLTVRAFRSGRFGSTPSFDATTDWPVLVSSLTNPSDLTTAVWQTSDAYVASDGTVVASVPTDAVLSIQLMDGLILPIRHATITFERSAADPTHLQNGIIAGVMQTEDVVASGRVVASLVSASLCGDAYVGIADQIRQSSDILHDGTNAPGVPCDAVSIGIHFKAVQIANPTKTAPEPSGANLCDGGVVADASASCTPADVSTYTPAPLTPPKAPALQCSQTQLTAFYNACLGPSSARSACDAFQATNTTCSSCLLSVRSDSTWGPIVTTSTTWDFNVAGCVSLTGDATCATAIAAAQGCEDTACAGCQFIGGDTPLPRAQCIQQADVGGCSSYVSAECDLSEAGAPACRVSDGSSTSFVAFASVFCHP
jgi:hypothetical protein